MNIMSPHFTFNFDAIKNKHLKNKIVLQIYFKNYNKNNFISKQLEVIKPQFK